MADEARNAGLDGILFPSQAKPGGMNLVVFDSSTRPATQLRVYDPDGALRKIF
jgi:RES domain-containing protein